MSDNIALDHEGRVSRLEGCVERNTSTINDLHESIDKLIIGQTKIQYTLDNGLGERIAKHLRKRMVIMSSVAVATFAALDIFLRLL